MLGLFRIDSDECTYYSKDIELILPNVGDETSQAFQDYLKGRFEITEEQILSLACGDEIEVAEHGNQFAEKYVIETCPSLYEINT